MLCFFTKKLSQDIASVFDDEEFFKKIVVNATEASGALAEFRDLRKITNDSSLAIISLSHVRQMILDQIEL